MYLQIILNLPVNQPFTYSYTPDEDEKPELKPEIGKRAEIMFGNKKTSGFIIEISENIPDDCAVDESKIRPVKRIIDKEPLFGEELIEHFLIDDYKQSILKRVLKDHNYSVREISYLSDISENTIKYFQISFLQNTRKSGKYSMKTKGKQSRHLRK